MQRWRCQLSLWRLHNVATSTSGRAMQESWGSESDLFNLAAWSCKIVASMSPSHWLASLKSSCCPRYQINPALQPNSSKLFPAKAASWHAGFAASRFQVSRLPWEQGRLQRFQGPQNSKVPGLQGSPGIQGCKSSRVADFQGRVAEL